MSNEKFGPNGEAVAAFVEQLAQLTSDRWSAVAQHIDARFLDDVAVLREYMKPRLSASVHQAVESAVTKLFAPGGAFATAKKSIIESENTRTAVRLAAQAVAAPGTWSEEALTVTAERFEPAGIDMWPLFRAGGAA